ncbi:hypothetical protein KKD84_02965, partial [Patescibacteria group bacterium]|nr:hypothetical protein [Patescibacteria group bacterium]
MLKPIMGDLELAWFTHIPMRKNGNGLMGIGSKNGNNTKFNSEDFGKIFGIVAGEIALSIENSRLYKQILKEARFDALTGIFNRRTLMKVLAAEFSRYQRKKYPLSVAIFDM